MLADKSVRDLLSAFSSADPTPGGGSASALASAVGASLLMMVAALPKTRSASEIDRPRLAEATRALTDCRARLVDAIDADTAAYDRVVAAYKMAKATDDEKSARKEAIQRALRSATDVPLDVMRLSAEALDAARIVAAHGNRGASSDVGVAVAMLGAGVQGARLNVDINLEAIQDAAYRTAAAEETARLAQRAAAAATEAQQTLRELGIRN